MFSYQSTGSWMGHKAWDVSRFSCRLPHIPTVFSAFSSTWLLEVQRPFVLNLQIISVQPSASMRKGLFQWFREANLSHPTHKGQIQSF